MYIGDCKYSRTAGKVPSINSRLPDCMCIVILFLGILALNLSN